MFELTLEERGAYNTVLDLIYSRANHLPDDDRFIAGCCRCDLRVWRRIKGRLIKAGKIRIEDGEIRNNRADVEIVKALGRVASAREAGVTSGHSRRHKSHGKSKENNNVSRTDAATETERTPELSTTTSTKKERAVLRTEQLSPLVIDPGSDLKTTIWNAGLAWLAKATARPEASLRTMLGKWCRTYDEEQVWAVLCAAARDGPVEPVAWINQALKARNGKSRHNAMNDYRGQDEMLEVLNGHAGEEGAAAPAVPGEDDRRLLAAAARPG